MKIVTLAIIARRLVRRRLLSRRTVFASVALWCAATATVFAVASRFVAPSWTVACAVAALVPLARVGLAAVALDRARHA